jgi:CBS-domain-containing membrane protein
LYKSGDEKLKFIKDSGKYKIDGDYVYAYKGIRSDRYSKHNFQYQYHVGKTYTCHADHNPENENSFGLSAWTLDEARRYCDELIVLVKIHKDDLAALVHDSNKIRCSKFTIIEDIERN